MRNILILLFVLVLLLVYVILFTPNIPIGDQWDLISLLKDPSISNIIAPINEHIPIVPRIIAISTAYLTGWSLKAENIVSLLIFFFIILNIYRAFNSETRDHLMKQTFFAAILVQLSPVHHESLLWAGTAHLLALLMLVIAINQIKKAGYDLKSFIVLLISLVIGSFSFLSGLLGWVLCVIGWMRLKNIKKQFLIAFLSISFIIFCLYIKYLSFHSTPAANINQFYSLGKAMCYFFLYMGANFIPTFRMGALLPLLLVATAIWGFIFSILGSVLIVKTWNYEKTSTIIPYLMMTLSTLQALITSIGRSNYGLQYALLSRYHAFQMLYFFGFIWLLLLYLHKNNLLQLYNKYLLTVFMMLIILNWAGGIGLGIMKKEKFKPIENELKNRQENIRAEYGQQIYSDQTILRDKIIMLKQLNYNVFRGQKRE